MAKKISGRDVYLQKTKHVGGFLAGVKHTFQWEDGGGRRSQLLWNTFQGGIDIQMVIKGTKEDTEGQGSNASGLSKKRRERKSFLVCQVNVLLF